MKPKTFSCKPTFQGSGLPSTSTHFSYCVDEQNCITKCKSENICNSVLMNSRTAPLHSFCPNNIEDICTYLVPTIIHKFSFTNFLFQLSVVSDV